MKKIAVWLMSLLLVPGAFAADLGKAKAEGQANLYANITAIEPLMEDFSCENRHPGHLHAHLHRQVPVYRADRT